MKLLTKLIIAVVVIVIVGVLGAGWFYTHSLYAARNWGGTVTVNVPQGGEHISTAWKGNELWTETYFPAENKCVFKQESQYNLIQGSVVISPCNYRSGK